MRFQHCSVLGLLLETATAWMVVTTRPRHRVGVVRQPLQQSSENNIVDVEFDRVEEDSSSSKTTSIVVEKQDNDDDDDDNETSNTLLDISLNADPDWKDARVPFLDGENYIDVKLAFMTELDGTTYGIATPFDPVVAVAFEKADGTAIYLDPDDDENEELMQLMATQLQEHVGEDLQLKRTPRVLTVSGPLENYTKNWRKKILPNPVDVETLLQDDDEDDDAGLESLFEFMKQELGEEEYEKTLKESPDSIDPDMLALFDIPGLGTEEGDVEGVEELFNSLLEEPEDQLKALDQFGLGTNSTASLKLVGYILGSGKSYSLVQILQPYVIMGKYVEAAEDTHFELLSKEEAALVEPRLGEVCREDLKKAGLMSTT